MPHKQRLTKPTKYFPTNGTQTNTKLTEKKPMRNSVISMKLMMSSPTKIEDLTMMRLLTETTLIKMLTKLSRNSINNMELRMKVKSNSLTSTTQTEREITMKFLEYQSMLP